MALQGLDPAQRQLGQRPHIEIDHGELLGAVALGGRAEQAEAGIVDNDGRLQAAGEQLMRDPGRSVDSSKVHRHHVGFWLAGRRDLAGDGRKLGLAPGDEGDLVPVLGKNPG